MSVRLVISICHPLHLVSYNDRMGVDYATTLTQALLLRYDTIRDAILMCA